MTESRRIKQPETTPDPHRPDSPTYPGTPRWVKVAIIIIIVLVLLFVVLHLTGLSPMGSHMNMNNMVMPPTPLGVQQP